DTASVSKHGGPAIAIRGLRMKLATIRRGHVLALRHDRVFYRLTTVSGEPCFGVGFAADVGSPGSVVCQRGFPGGGNPVLDFSVYESTRHDVKEFSLFRVEGFAADGVAAVQFLRPNGEVALTVRVSRNVYSAASVPKGPIAGYVALDTEGKRVWRSPEGATSRLVLYLGRTYEAAGVSLATAESIVERLRAAVESTGAEGFGAFAGLYPLDERRLLAASTDSVGSKLMLARRAGRLRWAGMDLAAHCVNDVLCSGADPLFLLDYVAANRIDAEQVAELVEGAADVCRAAGCAILGGETAELPGIYRPEGIDFCGTCVGVGDRRRLIDRSRAERGDAVPGLPSAGIHANGFSLVRQLVGDSAFDADLVLPPTRLYLDDVRAWRARADVRALAHVTGGGIAGNLARSLREGVGAVV